MVHEKKKSGDPDYDDKVPAAEHQTVVRGGDGTIIARLDPALGPVSMSGEHVNLTDPDAEELDTRPAPGEVAEEKATVQTYKPEDVPREEVSVDEALTPADDSAPAVPEPATRVKLVDDDESAKPAPAKSAPTPAKRGGSSGR